MHTRPTKLNDLVANWFENLKLEFLRAIVTQVGCGVQAGLQTVSAHNLACGQMFDDEMVANGIKAICIQLGSMGLCQFLGKLEVEFYTAPRGGSFQSSRRLGEPHYVLRRRSNQ